LSEVVDNEKQKEENNVKDNSKEKPILKINTKKGSKSKEVPKESKFQETDKISPQYVSGLEEENAKLRLHLVLLQLKYGEITNWVGGMRKFLMDKGLEIQVKSKENEGLLNITDKNFDVKFLAEQVKKGVEEYNNSVKSK
jgi:hypothetical protein